MSDNLATWLRSQVDDDETLAESDYDIMISARKVRDAAAEITRLRAALTTAQVEAFKKAAEIARQFAQSEGWSGTSALRLRNCIIAEASIYTKTGGKDE